MPTEIQAKVSDVLAVMEHLEALVESREIVMESGDTEQIAAIDRDIAEYAQKCPDGFAQAIKLIQAQRENLKATRSALAGPYTRKEAALEGREAFLRSLAMRVITQYGDLKGEVFSISKQQGQQYVNVFNGDIVPPEYIDIIPEKRIVNANKVEAALKANKEVPGCRLERRQPFVVVR